jgi:hypothetical protein
MVKTFETFIEEERTRLNKDREDAQAKLQTAQDKIDAVERELAAITAYEQVKAGKGPQTQRKPRAPSKSTATGHRAPKGAGAELQKRIIAVIEQFPDGATAEIINSELEATDAEAKKPIAAALFKMKKTNALRQPKTRGPYLIPTPTREAFEPPAGE